MTTVLMVDDSLARIVTRQRPGNIATPIGAVVSKRSPIDTRRDAGRLLMLYFALLRHSAQAAAFLGMSPETLWEVYGHHHADYQQEAAKAVSRKKRAGNG